MEYYLNHFLEKLQMILSTASGWVAGCLLILLNAVVAHKVTITLVVAVVLLDLAWGIAASIKQKRFTTSELARDTIGKFAVYGTAILTFCFIDRIMGESVTLTTAVIGGVIMLVELWSIAGNALIVFPNMPFLRLLRPALKGEIANKLRVSPDDVDEAFAAYKKARSRKKGAKETSNDYGDKDIVRPEYDAAGED